MVRTLTGIAAVLLSGGDATLAQTTVPGDPYASDPMGIVADARTVHPTPQGYAVMKPLALAAIAKPLDR